jgi:hypothetical protein
VTRLRKMMLEELERRNYSASTTRAICVSSSSSHNTLARQQGSGEFVTRLEISTTGNQLILKLAARCFALHPEQNSPWIAVAGKKMGFPPFPEKVLDKLVDAGSTPGAVFRMPFNQQKPGDRYCIARVPRSGNALLRVRPSRQVAGQPESIPARLLAMGCLDGRREYHSIRVAVFFH